MTRLANWAQLIIVATFALYIINTIFRDCGSLPMLRLQGIDCFINV